ncbi:acyltransferase [Aquihabitans sp. McL0605]|uniref:acyltransferase n=1 Tax=Aquihabitans sp. McL0605 TaxID=3415671 RepID=UPI003CF780F4
MAQASGPRPGLGSVVKRHVRWLRRSPMPVRDAAQVGFALVFRRRGHLVASTVRYRGARRVVHDGPFYFGILCNRLFHAPGDRGALLIHDAGTLVIGADVKIAASARITVGGHLAIGSHTRINHGAKILANTVVTIGEGVAMGPECLILDDDLHDLTVAGVPRTKRAAITVADRVWIGSRCTLLKGTEIGEGSIIAAGSVVTGVIPAGVVAGGSPARVLATAASWTP